MFEASTVVFEQHTAGAWVAFALLFAAIPAGVVAALIQIWRGKGRWKSKGAKWLAAGLGAVAALVLVAAYRDMFWNRFFEVRLQQGNDLAVELRLLFPPRVLLLGADEVDAVELVPGTRGMGRMLSVISTEGRVLRSPDLSESQGRALATALGSVIASRAQEE